MGQPGCLWAYLTACKRDHGGAVECCVPAEKGGEEEGGGSKDGKVIQKIQKAASQFKSHAQQSTPYFDPPRDSAGLFAKV